MIHMKCQDVFSLKKSNKKSPEAYVKPKYTKLVNREI